MNPRYLLIVFLVLAAVLVGASLILREQFGGTTPEPAAVSKPMTVPLSVQVARARLTGSLAALDQLIESQRARCERLAEKAENWRVLGEACLERCLLRDNNKGMAVGRPTHTELPEANRRDIEAGLAAIDKAIELRDPDPDVFRIRSSLLSLSATKWMEVLSLRPKIQAALKAAEKLDPTHPRVVIARACEKLFAPNRFLGHDPAAAERMLLKAGDALTLDERPFVLAAMCAHLLGHTDDAKAHLRRGLERNPNNRYAREVLRRIEAAEDDPFGRDVD